MKKLCFLMGLLLAAAGVRAQEQDDTARRLDSLQRVVTELTSNVQTLETEDLNQAIWKDRAKYFNIGYVNQTMTDKTFGGELETKSNLKYTEGGDMNLNGVAYQIKYTKATFTDEKTIQNLK